MGFKVGDKVMITELESSRHYRGKIGTVIEVDRIKMGFSSRWDYLCKFEDELDYPFCPKEMKRISVKGKQLLLFEV